MRKRRIAAILLGITLLVTFTGYGGWWWLMHTGSGANWALNQARKAISDDFQANRVSGDLSSGLVLSRIRFESESIRVEAATARVEMGAGFWPLSLDIRKLHANSVRLYSLPGDDGASGEKELSIELELPVRLTFTDLRIAEIEYYGPAEADALVVHSIEAAGHLSDTLVLERLQVVLPEDRLELSGQAALAYPHDLSIAFQSNGRYVFKGNLQGNVENAGFVLDTNSPAAHASGTVKELLRRPAWDLVIDAPLLPLPLDSTEPAAKLSAVHVQSAGQWSGYDLVIDATMETPWLEPTRFSLLGEGSESLLTAKQLNLDGRELSLAASGMLAWADEIVLRLDTTVTRIDPNFWLPEWPDEHPVNGRFTLKSEGDSWSLDDFSLAVARTSLVAAGTGAFDPQTEAIALALTWRDFSWPFTSENSTVASENGSLELSGQLDDWQLDGDLHIRSGEFPGGNLSLVGTGDQDSVNLILKEGRALGGTLSGNLFWQWTGKQPFKADVAARQVQIAPLFPEYPGVLNSRFSVSGEIEPLHLTGTIHQLDGTILDLPVKGYGGFHFEHGRVFADGIFLSSGSSTLTLDGSLFESAGIAFSVKSDSLEHFNEDLGGSLAADGTISLDPESPRLSLALSGNDLTLGPVQVQRVETRHTPQPGTSDVSEVVLSGLLLGQRPVESLVIRFDGERPLQWADLRVHTEDTDIHLALNGALTDWNDPISSGWSGELSELNIDHLERFNLTLDKAAGLSWNRSEFLLEPTCLSGTRGAQMCVSSAWQDPGELSVSANLAAIPVSLVDLVIDSDLAFTQFLSGTLSWSQSATTRPNAVAQFQIRPGSVRVEDDEEIVLETGDGNFGFEMSRGKLQHGILNLEIPGTGEIAIDFNAQDLSLGTDSPIQGTVRVDFRDLSVLGKILPLMDSINGEIDVDLKLAGVINHPTFFGSASIRNGHFSNTTSGFSFSEINIAGEVSESDHAELAGTFRAGEGTGDIKALVHFERILSPVVTLALQGQSLTIIDVPDLLVIADPDITLGWKGKTLDINGHIGIPQARLSPSYLPQTSARQSDDVVIVAGELPVPEDNYLQDNPIKIRGKLEVDLGSSSEIELEFAKVHVSGTTLFTWKDEILPFANGNFDIQGDIQAYGQELKITRGRIGFPDIPADNPHLNIRAEREIYGNSQIQKAGLMVVGTAKRPIIEAYTVPMTNKDRARTLLVTGSDFNYEQGVGAVAVGTYVLPKLYVSYGIGVFEEGRVISARYDLGSRFGIKVTSGQKDTGVDLNYTIER